MSRIFWLNAAVIRKKEDRVPLDRLFAEHTQTGAFRNIKLFSALPLNQAHPAFLNLHRVTTPYCINVSNSGDWVANHNTFS